MVLEVVQHRQLIPRHHFSDDETGNDRRDFEAEAGQWTSNPGYTKAQWITDAFGTGIPSMPRIKAVVWMNDNLTASEGCCNWSIESSSSATSAYAQAVAPSSYRGTWPQSEN